MPRIRSPERDKAFEIYKESGGKIENRRIAEQLGISEKTVGGWKCKDKWEQQLSGVLPKKKRSTPKKKGGQPNNKNAVGHGAPPENKNAEKHGFFSKWLPPETLEIVQEIEERSALNLLWDQIIIQYTAIIRAQKLMFVKDQQDVTIAITHESEMGTSYDVQQAWDKHERFLSAQSRAMTALNSLIKQYEEMLQHEEEKADIAEERRERIAKIKAETKRISDEKQDKTPKIEIIMSSEVSQYAE